MISVAAELASMHPQTLRMYEERGLIRPQRSAKGTRLYSQTDVERLRRIQEMTVQLGMNLAGVERVFELEHEIERMNARVERMRSEMQHELAAMQAELEQAHHKLRADIVLYRPGGPLVTTRQDIR